MAAVVKGKSGGKKAGSSINPESFIEGGGLISNFDGEVKEARFEMFDYGGRATAPTLRLTIQPDGDESAHDEHYSIGKVEIDEEANIITSGALTKSCKGAMFINSVIEAGFPADRIEADPSVFEGMVAHWVREEVEDRPGLSRAPRADGRVYKETVLLVDAIKKLPWEKAGAGAGKGGGAKAKAEPEGESDGMSEKALEAVRTVLKKSPKLDQKGVASAVFQLLKQDPDRNAIVQAIMGDEQLAAGIG